MGHGVTLIQADGTGSELTSATQRSTPMRASERGVSRAASRTSKHSDAITRKLSQGS